MTRHGYLVIPTNAGHQLPNRTRAGKGPGGLRFHALGCIVDGGSGLPPGVCDKCTDDISSRYVSTLMRVDRKARSV
ncbi:hypothetical protein ACPYOC_07305 [Ornithinimicrobium sp. W1665]|uniref:hypothetical protein n=1 Tax=Ornithinimicrobium sp. W1665 TaxID=3416666 RepID=UPI003CEC010B